MADQDALTEVGGAGSPATLCSCDGGPAFPVPDLSKTQCSGLSVRDWFAGIALQGLCASRIADDSDDGTCELLYCDAGRLVINPLYAAESLGRICYRLADAMIEARG